MNELEIKSQIPQNAKLVFKGILFNIYQWEQIQFDGTYKTFEMAQRSSNVQVLTTLNDKVILIEDMQPGFNKPKIGLPGGNVDFEEKIVDAAKRELFEETGIKCEDLELLSIDSLGSKVDRKFYLFIGYNSKQIKEAQHSKSEHINVRKLSFDDFIKETQKDDFRNPKLKELIFQMIHTKGELERFKQRLFK